MLLVTGIFMIVVGVLAAASLIAAKQPNAQAAIDKLVPYQGILGVIAALWGVWNVIQALIHISLLASHPLHWSLGLAAALVMLALGFILAYGLISKYAMTSPAAAASGAAIRLKLAPVQVPLGLISIALGIFAIVLFVL